MPRHFLITDSQCWSCNPNRYRCWSRW